MAELTESLSDGPGVRSQRIAAARGAPRNLARRPRPEVRARARPAFVSPVLDSKVTYGRLTVPDAPRPSRWRYFWRVGPRPPESTAFAELNAAPVVPEVR